MPSRSAASRYLQACVLVLFVAGTALSPSIQAQVSSIGSTAMPSSSSSAAVSLSTRTTSPVENPLLFWNLSINESLQNDSSTGWSDILTPSLSVKPGRHVSIVASLPWYPTLAAFTSTTINGTTTTALTQKHNVLGDANVSASAGGSIDDLSFNASGAVGFATGDQSLGVGAGKTSWHLGTHGEYSVGPFNPDVEAGIGNSSAFASHVIRKSYTAVGQMANFQAGTSVDLPRKISLDFEAYEAMPIQVQSIFGTISRRGSRGHGRSKKTSQGASGSGEDNGFNSGIEYPLTRKLTLGAEYDASVIQADSIVAFSVNWVLHTPNRADSSAPASPFAHPAN